MIHGYEATLSAMVTRSGQTLETMGADLARKFMFYGHVRWALDLANSPQEIAAFAQVGVFIPAGIRSATLEDKLPKLP